MADIPSSNVKSGNEQGSRDNMRKDFAIHFVTSKQVLAADHQIKQNIGESHANFSFLFPCRESAISSSPGT